jgi:hypothetical protein
MAERSSARELEVVDAPRPEENDDENELPNSVIVVS